MPIVVNMLLAILAGFLWGLGFWIASGVVSGVKTWAIRKFTKF